SVTGGPPLKVNPCSKVVLPSVGKPDVLKTELIKSLALKPTHESKCWSCFQNPRVQPSLPASNGWLKKVTIKPWSPSRAAVNVLVPVSFVTVGGVLGVTTNDCTMIESSTNPGFASSDTVTFNLSVVASVAIVLHSPAASEN